MNIVLRNVTKSFDRFVMQDFSHCFSGSGINVIVGESGCGKSTLLKLCAGLWQPDTGEVMITGCKKISFLFQEDRLLPWLTAKDNVLAVNKDEKVCQEVFAALGLKEVQEFLPGNMSGGMKRRAAIARAVAYDGDIFLLDEPFSGIDFKLKQNIMKWLKERLSQKLCILVTHDEQEAGYLGETVFNFTSHQLIPKNDTI